MVESHIPDLVVNNAITKPGMLQQINSAIEAGQVLLLHCNTAGQVLRATTKKGVVAATDAIILNLAQLAAPACYAESGAFIEEINSIGISKTSCTSAISDGITLQLTGHTAEAGLLITCLPALKAANTQTAATNKGRNTKLPLPHSNGEQSDVTPGLKKEISGLATIKELEKTLNATADIMRFSTNIIAVMSANGEVLNISQAASNVWDKSTDELIGANLLQLIVEDDKKAAEYAMAAALASEQAQEFETRVFQANGNIIYLLWSFNWSAESQQLYGTAQDITKLKDVQTRHKQKKEQLKQAQRLAKIGYVEIDLISNSMYGSGQFYSMLGVNKVYSLDLPVFVEHLQIDDLASVRIAFAQCVINYTDLKHEVRYIRDDGSVLHLSCHAFLQRDESGEVVKVIGTVQDITELKAAEDKLKNNEQRFRAMVQRGSDMIGLLSASGHYQYVSPTVEKLLGYNPEQMIGCCAIDFVHPDDREIVERIVTDINHISKITLPLFRFQNAAGEYRWIECSITNCLNDEGIEAIVTNSRDITDQKKALEEKERMAAIIEATSDFVGVASITGEVLYINSAAETLLGYSSVTEKLKFIPDFHPEWAARLIQEEAIPAAISNGIWKGETAMLTADGKEVPFSQVILSHRNSQGEVEFLSTIARDFTEIKEFEHALKVSTQRYQSLFDQNPDGVFALDMEGTIVRMNKSIAGLLEYDFNDFEPTHFSNYVAREDLEAAIGQFGRAQKGGTLTFELTVVTKSGTRKRAQITAMPIMVDGNMDGMFCILKDVTEKYRLDQEIAKTNDQLRALTAHIQMVREEERKFIAREIHDELGQVLTALKIDLTLLANRACSEQQPLEPVELKENLEEMMRMTDDTIGSIRRLVKSLRPMALEDLGLLSELRNRLERFKSWMNIESELITDMDEISLQPEQALDVFRILQESLTNVARHARATKVMIVVKQLNQACQIEVIDDGIGIDETQMHQTGSFGLVGMRERARNLGGKLYISKLPGKGSSVKLVVPFCKNEVDDGHNT